MPAPTQFVTFVTRGGSPVILSDQNGAPYPTTGNGALVFSNGPVLNNPIFTNYIPLQPNEVCVTNPPFNAVGNGITDDTQSFQDAVAAAIALGPGHGVFIPPGRYKISGQIVKHLQAISGFWIRGSGTQSVIVPYVETLANNFILIQIDGTLNNNGIGTVSPTYYFTTPVAAGSTVAVLNTTVGLSVGQYIMLCDEGNPVLSFDSATAGAKVTNQGEVNWIASIVPSPPIVTAISSGTYEVTEGTITLDMASSVSFGPGVLVTLSALTGTGDFALLDGDWITQEGTSGTTVVLQGPIGPGASTITGGNLTYGTMTSNTIVLGRATQFNYSGTTVNPGTSSTVIRTFATNIPQDVTVRDLAFDFDPAHVPKNTQTRILFRNVVNARVKNVVFYGQMTGVGMDGVIGFEVDQLRFDRATALTYCMTFSNSACDGRVTNVFARNARHLLNGGADTNNIESANVSFNNCIAVGMYASAFAPHPGCRAYEFTGCQAIGGQSVNAQGFLLRCREFLVDGCIIEGCYTGIKAYAGSGNTVRDTMINYCQYGVDVTRSPYTLLENLIINEPQLAAVRIDNVSLNSPFDVPYPGLVLKNIQVVKATPIPSSYLADFVYVLRNGNFPPVFGSDWRLQLTSPGRVPTYLVATQTLAASNYPFPSRYSYGVETLFASATITPGLNAIYLVDDSLGNVDVTLSSLGTGSECEIKKIIGVNTTRIIGVVDGSTNPTVALGTSFRLKDSAQNFTIVSGTYNNANGKVTLTMLTAVPFGNSATISISGATGTGAFASINGAQTTAATTLAKTVNFFIAPGLGATTITGGMLTFGGWTSV